MSGSQNRLGRVLTLESVRLPIGVLGQFFPKWGTPMASDGRVEHTDDLVDVTNARAIKACFWDDYHRLPRFGGTTTIRRCLSLSSARACKPGG
jgi:hypothetical protein